MTQTYSKSRQVAEAAFSRLKTNRPAPEEQMISAEDIRRAKTARLRETRLAQSGSDQHCAAGLTIKTANQPPLSTRSEQHE